MKRATLARVKEYHYVRYFFTNASSEIRAIFAEACQLIGVQCRRTTERNLSIAGGRDVALLDSFIGQKR